MGPPLPQPRHPSNQGPLQARAKRRARSWYTVGSGCASSAYSSGERCEGNGAPKVTPTLDEHIRQPVPLPGCPVETALPMGSFGPSPFLHSSPLLLVQIQSRATGWRGGHGRAHRHLDARGAYVRPTPTKEALLSGVDLRQCTCPCPLFSRCIPGTRWPFLRPFPWRCIAGAPGSLGPRCDWGSDRGSSRCLLSPVVLLLQVCAN